jgi:hypothetical protein
MWFECFTVHGSCVSIRHDGRIAHRPDPAAARIYLYRPASDKPLAFFVTREPEAVCFLEPSLYRSAAIPVLIKPHVDRVAILSVEERCYLTAIDVIGPDGFGDVKADRRYVSDWELFRLRPVSPDALHVHDLAMGAALLDLINAKGDVVKLRRKLTDKIMVGAFEGIFPLLARDDKTVLARQLFEDALFLGLLSEARPHDKWAISAARGLRDWLSGSRSGPYLMTIGPDFDWIGDRYLPEIRRGIRPISMPELVVRAARSGVLPTRTACILATARNEGVYFLEWLAYHRAIGFESFFIYTNDNDDHSDELLTALAESGAIHLVRSGLGPHANAQGKAYGHALGFHPAVLDYRWMMVCDLDEFLLLDENFFSNLRDFIEWHEMWKVDAINIGWAHISASGQRKWSRAAVIDRFDDVPFHLDTRIKSMFRPRSAAQSYAHFPAELDGDRLVFRNAVGDIRQTAKSEDLHGIHGRHLDDDPDFRMATIVHYYWKSAEEFLWKHSRTKGDHAFQKETGIARIHPAEIEHFLRHFGESKSASDRRPTAPRIFAKNLDVELYKLRSLPGVAGAEEKVISHFESRLDILKQQFSSPANLERLGELGFKLQNLLVR